MKADILLISLIISVGSAHATIYRSVDGQGNVIFSDQPGNGGEALDLPPVPTYTPPPAPASLAPGSSGRTPAPTAGYDRFVVVAPGDGQAFWDNAGNVEVRVVLEPGLRTEAGHRVIFYLDGEADGEAGTATSKVFENLDRGEHSVEAVIIDASGQTVQSTGKIGFQLHRQSLQSPQRKSGANPPPGNKNPKP